MGSLTYHSIVWDVDEKSAIV